MRHLRILGLCLAAVFVVAAFTAAGASAAKPEWGKCEAQAGGKYLDGNCQEKGKGGSFEWHKGATLPNIPFTGHNVGSGGVLSTVLEVCGYESEEGTTYPTEIISRKQCVEEGGNPEAEGEGGVPLFVECEAESNTGEASGKNLVLNVHVTFTGCAALGVIPCHSEGAEEGEVKVEPLHGSLGYINKAEKKVGVLLQPNEKGGKFAEFECGGFLANTVGVGPKKQGPFYGTKGGNDGIISPIEPVNTTTSTYTQVYSVNEKDENVPRQFETGKSPYLLENVITALSEEGNKYTFWDAAGEEITNENLSSEPGEIKTK